MGSGVLLAALVVLWFVVLVPMVVTRGDAQGGRAELADSGRTLQRRRTVDPVVHADTERVSVDRDLLRTSGELQVDVHALRRRTLGGLVAAGRADPGRRAGLQPLAVDGAGAPRPRRRRLRARAAQGGPPRAAGRPPGGPCRGPARRCAPPRRPAPVRRRRSTRPSRAAASLPHPSVPLAPVRRSSRARVVAARTPAPAGWQQSAVVGLDDDDIGFADIDEYQPRRVRQRLIDRSPALRRRPRWWRRGAGTVVSPPKGLWRSPVAHLVRIEGVRGSTPLSSTPSQHDTADAVGALRPGGVRRSRTPDRGRPRRGRSSNDGPPRRSAGRPDPGGASGSPTRCWTSRAGSTRRSTRRWPSCCPTSSSGWASSRTRPSTSPGW